jgi:hypothetical protein
VIELHSAKCKTGERSAEQWRSSPERFAAPLGGVRADKVQCPGSCRASQILERFANLYETGQIPEYHDTITTVLNWSNEILNWHHTRRSNGPLEGINNLIQTLRRTAHGFTNPHNYAARALLLS